ncbi:hypothetical protein QMZ05_26070 [Bradyrhizobium sp. INPA03-11B]
MTGPVYARMMPPNIWTSCAGAAVARDFASPLFTDGKDHVRHFEWQMAIPRREVAMRAEPRCAQCDSEEPKIICLRNPAGERYCGRLCLYQGQANFIRWFTRSNAEAAS